MIRRRFSKADWERIQAAARQKRYAKGSSGCSPNKAPRDKSGFIIYKGGI